MSRKKTPQEELSAALVDLVKGGAAPKTDAAAGWRKTAETIAADRDAYALRCDRLRALLERADDMLELVALGANVKPPEARADARIEAVRRDIRKELGK